MYHINFIMYTYIYFICMYVYIIYFMFYNTYFNSLILVLCKPTNTINLGFFCYQTINKKWLEYNDNELKYQHT